MSDQFIEQQKHEFLIAVMCQALDVSESGLDAWRKRPTCQRQREDAQIRQEIRTACLTIIRGDMEAHGSIGNGAIKDEASRVNGWPD